MMNNDLNIIVTENPGIVSLKNFEELKINIQNYLEKYFDSEYVLEQIDIAKKDKKELRALRKKITDTKREIKRLYIAPYEEFEEKINELINMIDIPLKKIEDFIKQEELINKSLILEDYINDKGEILGGHLEKIKNSPAFNNPKWKNSSYTISKIKQEINQKINKAASDLQAIKLSKNENMASLMAHYYETLSLEGCFNFLDSIENERTEQEIKIDEKTGYKIIKINGNSTQINLIVNYINKMNIDYEILEEDMN